MSCFKLPLARRFKYATKSGNLAACFLGFSTCAGAQAFERSAQLGMLASAFDLVSDVQKYEAQGMISFTRLVNENLEPDVAGLLLKLMERKKNGKLTLAGLDRGVDAFRVIIKHLRADNVWHDEARIMSTGILLQVVDDLLDYRVDLRNGDLNFLRDEDLRSYTKMLVNWDFKEVFRDSLYPAVLFAAISKAQTIALKLPAGGVTA